LNTRYNLRPKKVSDEYVIERIIKDLNNELDHKYGPDFEIKEAEMNTSLNEPIH